MSETLTLIFYMVIKKRVMLVSNLNSIYKFNTVLSCILIYFQVPGIRMWAFLEGHYSASHKELNPYFGGLVE